MSAPFTVSAVAVSVPFDNTTNGFVANNVQAAIEEARYNLFDSEASGTSAITATTSDTLMSGMTLTPAAGSYLTWFSCDINSATTGSVTSISIYVGGVQKADSLRKVQPFDGGTLSATTARCGVATNGVVSVNGSQAIEIRWSDSNGTNTVNARTLNILRVS